MPHTRTHTHGAPQPACHIRSTNDCVRATKWQTAANMGYKCCQSTSSSVYCSSSSVASSSAFSAVSSSVPLSCPSLLSPLLHTLFCLLCCLLLCLLCCLISCLLFSFFSLLLLSSFCHVPPPALFLHLLPCPSPSTLYLCYPAPTAALLLLACSSKWQ